MYKIIPLLVTPLVFTFIFDYYVVNNDHANKAEIDLNNSDYIKENIINVHKNFNLKFNSATINKLYSKKIIEDSQILNETNIAVLKPKKKYLEKKEIFKTNNSLNLISSKWQNSFSSKKIKFIKTVLPLIEYENQKILLERKKLIAISNYLSLEKTLNKENLEHLRKVTQKYKVFAKNKHKIDLINELLTHVNVIPNSIVLAQAANESGWGTSRFAIEYNALFGQYTYDEKNGIIPNDREKGKKHLIKNFSSINKSVESYFININTHYAYKNFRERRSQMTDLKNDFNIKILTSALDVYAEDKAYVDTINNIIETNSLNQFDLITKVLTKS